MSATTRSTCPTLRRSSPSIAPRWPRAGSPSNAASSARTHGCPRVTIARAASLPTYALGGGIRRGQGHLLGRLSPRLSPAFADRVPYNVVVAELAEGPRLISNVIGIDGAEGLAIDTPLRFSAQTEGDVPVARFTLA